MKSLYLAMMLMSAGAMAATDVSKSTDHAAAASDEAIRNASASGDRWYNKLSIGTRLTYFQLQDDQRTLDNSYIGHLSILDAQQDLVPWKLFAQYSFCRYCGLELTWDSVQAKLVNLTDDGVTRGNTDGELTMMGPILSVRGLYPNHSVFTPYLSLGVAPWSGSIDHYPWHEKGYPSPEAYAASHNKGKLYAGTQREITVGDDVGVAIGGGCEIKLGKNWSADLLVRYLNVASDTEYTVIEDGVVHRRQSGTFTMEHIAYGAGVKYSF